MREGFHYYEMLTGPENPLYPFFEVSKHHPRHILSRLIRDTDTRPNLLLVITGRILPLPRQTKESVGKVSSLGANFIL
jgi:hypothetical protein